MSCVSKPSLGLSLILATLGFGADRFYVGQLGLGIVLLISYITIFGLLVALPFQFITMISLIIAIFTNRTRAFMYGSNIEFEAPNTFDKVVATLWLLFVVAAFIGVLAAFVR